MHQKDGERKHDYALSHDPCGRRCVDTSEMAVYGDRDERGEDEVYGCLVCSASFARGEVLEEGHCGFDVSLPCTMFGKAVRCVICEELDQVKFLVPLWPQFLAGCS